MNANTKFFIGADMSKPYFDASLMKEVNHEKQPMETRRFENNKSGIKAFDKWLKSHKVLFDSNTLLVIENTGIYHRLLWAYCSDKNLPIHIGNAAHIKWSFGIARGKNDVIDSIRLCHYAFKEGDSLKSTPVLNPVLMQLKDMMTSRTKLLSQINSIKTYIRELKNVNDKSVQSILEKAHKSAIEGLALSIKNIESHIKKIITQNKELQNNYDLLITVPGIGHLTAVYIICCTNNFAFKITGKQLACYAGVVPFEYTSGISVKGRSRVHHMANKDLKKLLHLCAVSSIQNHEEFKTYYDRKKKEGKHSMSILNAIRNKIILRAAAVVNNQKPYVHKHDAAA
jgi:transposase